jgi:hypothetical protein
MSHLVLAGDPGVGSHCAKVVAAEVGVVTAVVEVRDSVVVRVVVVTVVVAELTQSQRRLIAC